MLEITPRNTGYSLGSSLTGTQEQCSSKVFIAITDETKVVHCIVITSKIKA
jgi:hypothetical protein